MRELTGQQRSAVEKLRRLRVGALFMACGTGKTQTACALVNSIEDSDLLIWLCPCQTMDNLKKEISLCGLNRDAEIIGIESVGCSGRIYAQTLEMLKSAERPVLICDESLKIKNMDAVRTKRILELGKAAYYRLILNGTPVTKNILDIYAQMEFLSPLILKCSFGQFKSRYCRIVEKRVGWRKVDEFIKGYENVDHLLSVIDPYIFQCDLQLRLEKEHETIRYNLDEESREGYDFFKEKLIEDLERADDSLRGTLVLGAFQKMQQAYCCAEEKFEALGRIADGRTLVFCKFIKSAEAVRKRFPGLTVLTYGKNSIGLNLQDMNKCVYFDKTFDFAFAEQSEYRIFRTGQTEDCKYYHLTGTVGLEKVFDDCIRKKISLVNYFKENGNKILEEL